MKNGCAESNIYNQYVLLLTTSDISLSLDDQNKLETLKLS